MTSTFTVTFRVYEIFKAIVELNQYRFRGLPINEVIDQLIDFADLDTSYISRQYLAQRITAYCNEYDTGIYY